MRYLITGGYGDTGAILYKLFRERGLDIVHFEKGKDIQADRVLHLAAKSPPAGTEQIIGSNVLYLQEMVNYAVKNRIKEMVFFSAMSVYGKLDKEDVMEEDCITGTGLYGVSKLMGEEILRNSPLKVVCLRLPAILGHRNTTNFMSRCYMKLRDNEDVELTNAGRQFNNFISVENVFDFLADLKLSKKFDVVNLASKKGMTVLEIVEMMKGILKSKSGIIVKEGKSPFFNISTEKAEIGYSFKPHMSEQSIVEWLKKRQEYERNKIS